MHVLIPDRKPILINWQTHNKSCTLLL